MATVGDLAVNLTARTRDWTSGLNAARGGLGSFVSSVVSSLGAVGLAVQGASAIFNGLKKLTVGVELAAQAEQTQVAFATMLGSADAAKQVLSDLNQFAASTPFELPGIEAAARSLLAFGVSQQQLMPTLKMLGDVSAGTGKDFQELSVIYGQIRAAGKLMGGDLLQLINAGVPILGVLAKQFGKTEGEVKKMVEAGQVGFPDVQRALQTMTSEGGVFNDMMSAQSQTLGGLWSTLKDNATMALRDIGAALVESFDMKALLTDTTSFIDQFRATWLPGIVSVLNAVGETFQGALILLREAWDGWLGDTYQTLAFAVANYDVLWAIAVEQVKLFAANGWEHFKTFFVNAGEWLVWFSDNWRDVFFTAFDLVTTVFANLGENIRSFWSALWDYITGNADSFEFDWTPLTDGFRTAIGELPELTRAGVQATTPELERLYGELGRREAEARARAESAAAGDAKKFAPGKLEIEADKKATKTKDVKGIAAVQQGSKEAYSAIQAAIRGGLNSPEKKTEKNTAEIAKNSARTNEKLDRLNDRVKNQPLEVVSIPGG